MSVAKTIVDVRQCDETNTEAGDINLVISIAMNNLLEEDMQHDHVN